MGDIVEGTLRREGEVIDKMGPGTKTNWPTGRPAQRNLKLNLRHCTTNYKAVLSSGTAPCNKHKESNCESNQGNIWSPASKDARHQDRLAD
jgi:hypothetical protein